MPKKQVKRVLKLAEKYYWNSAAKQFAIRLKSGDRLIPDPKQRKELVMQAHYFGHFQDATEERVRTGGGKRFEKMSNRLSSIVRSAEFFKIQQDIIIRLKQPNPLEYWTKSAWTSC